MISFDLRFPKSCACGLTHNAEQWAQLSNPRVWNLAGDRLELRECVCGSTITIPADELAAVETSLNRAVVQYVEGER